MTRPIYFPRSVIVGFVLVVIILGIFSIIASAPAPPGHYTFNQSQDYDRSFDEVWEAIIGFFASNNIPIRTIEKNSGIIVSDEMTVPFDRVPGSTAIQSDYCDCGSPGGFNIYKEVHGTYNIFVRRFSSSTTSVQVNTKFKASVWTGNQFGGWIDCTSKGYLERKIIAYLNSRL